MFATIALLLAAVTAARADTICRDCTYPYPQRGGYLGAYWPGDRGTFNHVNTVRHYVPHGPYGNGTFVQFDNYWVFDLHDNAAANLTATHRLLTDWGAELYTDAGSVCAGEYCTVVALGTVVASHVDVAKRWEIKVDALVPGRYVIRIAGATTEGGSYTGQVSFR